MTQPTKVILLFLTLFLCSLPAVAKDTSLGVGMELPEGNVDRQQELQHIFDRATETGQRVELSAGIYRHSGLLYIRGIDVSGVGPATVIQGTTRNNSSIVLTGSGAKLSHVKLTYNSTTRSGYDQSVEALVKDADHFEVSDLTIDGGDGAGILVRNAHHGIIANNDIRNTLADSIHMTDGSSDIIVHDNTTHYSGDDGVAVVSYERDGKKVHDIEAFHNTIIDNKVARGMSVVGGDNVYYHDNFIKCSGPWAGIYIASESSFKTFGASNIRIINNIVKDCGQRGSGYDAISTYSDYNNNEHILFEGNVLVDSKWMGFHIAGKDNSDINLKNNVILHSVDKAIYAEPDVPPFRQSGNTIVNAGQ